MSWSYVFAILVVAAIIYVGVAMRHDGFLRLVAWCIEKADRVRAWVARRRS